MKKYMLIICCLMLLGLTACGDHAGACKDDSLEIAKLMDSINTKTNDNDWKAGILQDNSIDAASLQNLYHINSVDVQEYTVRTALLETDATEIAIFHVTNDKMQEVKDGVAYRIESLKTKWKELDKKQYTLVKNHKTFQCGNYYFMIIAKDADAIADYMESY